MEIKFNFDNGDITEIKKFTDDLLKSKDIEEIKETVVKVILKNEEEKEK